MAPLGAIFAYLLHSLCHIVRRVCWLWCSVPLCCLVCMAFLACLCAIILSCLLNNIPLCTPVLHGKKVNMLLLALQESAYILCVFTFVCVPCSGKPSVCASLCTGRKGRTGRKEEHLPSFPPSPPTSYQPQLLTSPPTTCPNWKAWKAAACHTPCCIWKTSV